MTLKTLYRKLQSDSAELNTMQSFISAAFETVRNLLEKKSALTEYNLTIAAAGSIIVQHSLGRVPFGWNISDRNSAATVYRSAWDANTITFVVSGALTFNVEVW
jgi:hypothetical protein